MTHPKQTLTPGQAAREAYAKYDHRWRLNAKEWDAIAAAAIEAFLAKQSGDRYRIALEQIASGMRPQPKRFAESVLEGNDPEPWVMDEKAAAELDTASEQVGQYNAEYCDAYLWDDAERERDEAKPAPPTENKDEREHCEQAASAYLGCEPSLEFVDLLLRERAAGRAEREAEIKELNAENERLFQLCKALGAQ